MNKILFPLALLQSSEFHNILEVDAEGKPPPEKFLVLKSMWESKPFILGVTQFMYSIIDSRSGKKICQNGTQEPE